MVGELRRVMHIQHVRAVNAVLTKTLILTGVLFTALVIWGSSPAASDQESFATNTQNTPEIVVTDTTGSPDVAVLPESYDFIVQTGDNMSKLVRRAIGLYDQALPDVELTNEQSMFAETNVVQEMGPRLLDVDEKFSLQRNLIEKYVVQVADLTQNQQAAWKIYSDRASYQINHITPTNVPLTKDGNLDTTFVAPTVDEEKTTTDAPSENGAIPIYWWIIGIISISAVAVILWPKISKN